MKNRRTKPNWKTKNDLMYMIGDYWLERSWTTNYIRASWTKFEDTYFYSRNMSQQDWAYSSQMHFGHGIYVNSVLLVENLNVLRKTSWTSEPAFLAIR